MSSTYTGTETYTVEDVEVVMRRVTADLVMIASSTGAVSEEKARNWGHDIELLAKRKYLKSADITLFSGEKEVRAVRFEVDDSSGALKMSRPGGVLWPKIENARLRIILSHTDEYTSDARSRLASSLKLNWSPTSEDTNHSALKSTGGREYESNGYGTCRKDYTS